MTRDTVNRIVWTTPVLMSLVAFLIVIATVATGWEQRSADEGFAAHLFQILIVLQAPLIAAFLFTARTKRVGDVAYFRL